MKDETTLKNLKINKTKLLRSGFIKESNTYKYEKEIMNNQFLLTIKINNNTITSDVIEHSTNDKFIPYYIKNTTGQYVGKIKEEYNQILEIIKSCSHKFIFKTEYANLIINYTKNKYNDTPEFLWKKLPEHAIIRNQKNQKWYCTLSFVEKKVIGIKEPGKIEIMNLLAEPSKIETLIDNTKYFPAYHMNKKHWFSIKLDGSIDINKIYPYIDTSYNLSINK